MPAYTIQHDGSWAAQHPARDSLAPTASVYSEDLDGEMLKHPDMPEIPPLRVKKPLHSSYHAHPAQHITDPGHQVRQSRLPIFQQVRSMLHKTPRPDMSHVKYDEFSGNPSATGKPAKIRPSNYRNPYEGHFSTQPNLPRSFQKQPTSVRSLSPVSILRHDEIQQYTPHPAWDSEEPPSPVSPVSDGTSPFSARPTQPSVNTPFSQSSSGVTRKPAPNRPSTSPEDIPPNQLALLHHENFLNQIAESNLKESESRFSWSTCAPSVAPARKSIDPKHRKQPSGEPLPTSRFSWSTTNTPMLHQNQFSPPSPAPSPPPLVAEKFRTPPVQSILSRHRPVQRLDKPEYTPPPRKASLPVSSGVMQTPARAKPAPIDAQTGSGKRLPPPPELLTPISPMSHLEILQTEEQDKVRQRKNLQKAISGLVKVESASPLEVSFAQVKEAKIRLGELRTTLESITCEEREIGIAISRARRKEGEEEGLWVRRVTG